MVVLGDAGQRRTGPREPARSERIPGDEGDPARRADIDEAV